MNILHVSAQRPDSTGSGVYLRETVGALAALGHRQAVVAGVGMDDVSPFPHDVLFEPVRFDGEELPFPVVGMSDVMPYPSTRYRDLTPEMVAQFRAAFTKAFDHVFAQFKPDVVICHHLYLVCSVLAAWFSADTFITPPAISPRWNGWRIGMALMDVAPSRLALYVQVHCTRLHA